MGIFGIPKEKQRKKLKSTNIDKNFKIKILVPKSSACFPKRKKQKLNYDIDIEDKVVEIFHSLKDKGSITKIQKRFEIEHSTQIKQSYNSQNFKQKLLKNEYLQEKSKAENNRLKCSKPQFC